MLRREARSNDAGRFTGRDVAHSLKRCSAAFSSATATKVSRRAASSRPRHISRAIRHATRSAARALATRRSLGRRIARTSIRFMARRSASTYRVSATGKAQASWCARSSRSKVSTSWRNDAARRVARDLCRGPGRLCRALAIDRSFDGIDLFEHPDLWLAQGEASRDAYSPKPPHRNDASGGAPAALLRGRQPLS